MRLRSEADVQQFLEAVEKCGGDVYLKSPEGDIFNLKSSLARYIAVARLIEEEGDCLELFASRREDRARLMGLVADGDEFSGMDVECDDRGFVDDDLPVIDNERVGRTEVDGQLLSQRKDSHKATPNTIL